jgi:hypothetical protein
MKNSILLIKFLVIFIFKKDNDIYKYGKKAILNIIPIYSLFMFEFQILLKNIFSDIFMVPDL